MIKTFATKQMFPGCYCQIHISLAEVSAGYVLWCRCTAELHVLNDEYTRRWHLTMHFNWWDNLSVAVKVLSHRYIILRLYLFVST